MQFLACFGSSEEASKICQACCDGNALALLDIVRPCPRYLKSRCLPDKQTVWHAAAASGHVSLIEALVDHVWTTMAYVAPPKPITGQQSFSALGPDPSTQQQQQQPHPMVVEMLDIRSHAGLTPLMLACIAGHTAMVRCLLQQGMDAWAVDTLVGRTALHYAAQHNWPGAVEALLQASNMQTEPHVQQSQQQMKQNEKDWCVALPSFKSPAAVPVYARVGAMCEEEVVAEEVEVLKKSRKLVDARTHGGFTPLHYAALYRAVHAMEVLLAHGANMRACCWRVSNGWATVEWASMMLGPGSSVLHAAALKGDWTCCHLLLMHHFQHSPGQQQTVPDPRCALNAIAERPLDVGGVSKPPALKRLLDPAIPLDELVDPFGVGTASGSSNHGRPSNSGVGLAAAASSPGMGRKVAPLPQPRLGSFLIRMTSFTRSVRETRRPGLQHAHSLPAQDVTAGMQHGMEAANANARALTWAGHGTGPQGARAGFYMRGQAHTAAGGSAKAFTTHVSGGAAASSAPQAADGAPVPCDKVVPVRAVAVNVAVNRMGVHSGVHAAAAAAAATGRTPMHSTGTLTLCTASRSGSSSSSSRTTSDTSCYAGRDMDAYDTCSMNGPSPQQRGSSSGMYEHGDATICVKPLAKCIQSMADTPASVGSVACTLIASAPSTPPRDPPPPWSHVGDERMGSRGAGAMRGHDSNSMAASTMVPFVRRLAVLSAAQAGGNQPLASTSAYMHMQVPRTPTRVIMPLQLHSIQGV